MENRLRIEQWLFVLYVATLPFATVIPLSHFGIGLQLSDLLFLLAGLVWAVAFLIRRNNFRWTWFYACLAAYGVAVVLSTIASVAPSQSAVKLVGKFYLIGIAFLAFNVINSTGSLRRVLQGWTVGAALALILSLLGIGLFYAGWNDPEQNLVLHPIFGSLPPGNYPRIEGFFSYPSQFCNFLGVTWMFAIALTAAGWLRVRTFCLLGAVLLVVNAFTLTPGLGGIFLTTGLFVQQKLTASGRRGLARLAITAGIVVAAVFLFAASFTLFSYDPNGTRIPLINGELSASHRAHAWSTAFQTFLDDPILGRGIDMPIANSEFTDPSGNRQLLTDAHNTYISVLAETGLVGFAAFMSIILFVVFGVARWHPDENIGKAIRLCLLLALADALLYQGITGSYEDTRHVWALVGITAAIGTKGLTDHIPSTNVK